MKRYLKLWLTIGLMIVLTFALTGCGGGDSKGTASKPDSSGKSAQGEKLAIKFGHHHSVGGAVDKFANKLAEISKEKSDGNIEIQVFPGAQLGQEQEAIDGVNMGTLQMSIISPGMMDKYHPVFGIETMPFIFDSWDHADKALNGPAGEEMTKMLLEKSKIRILGYYHLGFRHMITRSKPIEKFEDINGLKMRSPEAWVWIRMFELLGTKPTPVTWGEAYTALQTGVVEGMESPAQNIIDMKFYEVTKNLTLDQHMFGTMTVITNEGFWQGLSDEQKQIIETSVKEALDYCNENVTRVEDTNAVKKLKELGMKVIEINDSDKWREAVTPMYEEFKERAPGADKIMELIDKAR